MKNTYTIQEKIQKGKKVYVVYKNGSPDKSFQTLEDAEKYKKKKEAEEEKKVNTKPDSGNTKKVKKGIKKSNTKRGRK